MIGFVWNRRTATTSKPVTAAANRRKLAPSSCLKNSYSHCKIRKFNGAEKTGELVESLSVSEIFPDNT